MESWCIRNVRIEDGTPSDLRFANGRIVDVGSLQALRGESVLDGSGLVALPGLVDLHAHFRDPGDPQAEDTRSGSTAAARGGYSAVCVMANTEPPLDSPEQVEAASARGRDFGLVDIHPVGAVTQGLRGIRLTDMAGMAQSSASVTMFSDDGECTDDPAVMRRALATATSLGCVVAQHAEDPRLVLDRHVNEGAASTRLGLRGRPGVAESTIVARDCLMAAELGARIHFCHLSTRASVEIVREAKANGVSVTAEVTPHHLALTDELITDYDTNFKMLPPLRRPSDVHALREAVADGTIDAIATDHAPHTPENKQCPWDAARPGVIGLETALSVVMLTLVETGFLDWHGVAERMSRAPARIARLNQHGSDLRPGAPANLTLIDPSARWTVSTDEMASRSTNSPFSGWALPGKVAATFLRGRPTWMSDDLTVEVGDSHRTPGRHVERARTSS